MTKIFKYNQFINEKYEENPEFRIKSFFEELEKNIIDWFTNGTFAASGAELGEIKRSLTNSIEKNLIFEFNDDEYYYQVYVIISIKDVQEDKLNQCYIKVKRYDAAELKLLRTIGEDVLVKDLNEDKILELISKLDEESDTLNLNAGNISINDDETDLEDTSII